MSQTQQIKLLLNGLAEYYGVTLTPARLAMYAEDLEDLQICDIGDAIKKLRRNPSQKFFPLPAAIREEILGNQKDYALEASNRIVEAITRHGYTNPECARQFIGELGWRIIEREGGWQSLCQRVTNDELPILKAQWRELAGATLRRKESGLDGMAPALEQPKNRGGELTSITKLISIVGDK